MPKIRRRSAVPGGGGRPPWSVAPGIELRTAEGGGVDRESDPATDIDADGATPASHPGRETRPSGAVQLARSPSGVSAAQVGAAHVARQRATVDLDPGVRATGDGGTELWLPSAGRVQRHDAPTAESARSADVLIGPLAKLERIDDGEAGAFAARFATDYLSFDEDDTTRRPDVLRRYLADPRASTLGWSGTGRQRADAPLPGRLDRRSDVVVFVEVTLRVTPYSRSCPSSDPAVVRADEPTQAVGPSSAPAGDPDAWIAGRAWWARMAVPVTRDEQGQLVVDLSLVPETATS